MRVGYPALIRIFRLVLSISCAGALQAADNALTATEAAKLIRPALSQLRFSGAPVEDLLLTEAQKKGSRFQYEGEFHVHKDGRVIRCEDWKFILERNQGQWELGEIRRGRCND